MCVYVYTVFTIVDNLNRHSWVYELYNNKFEKTYKLKKESLILIPLFLCLHERI